MNGNKWKRGGEGKRNKQINKKEGEREKRGRESREQNFGDQDY